MGNDEENRDDKEDTFRGIRACDNEQDNDEEVEEVITTYKEE